MKRFKFIISVLFLSLYSFWAIDVPTDYLVLSWTKQEGLVSEYHQIVDLPAHKEPKTSSINFEKVKLLGNDGELVGEMTSEVLLKSSKDSSLKHDLQKHWMELFFLMSLLSSGLL